MRSLNVLNYLPLMGRKSTECNENDAGSMLTSFTQFKEFAWSMILLILLILSFNLGMINSLIYQLLFFPPISTQLSNTAWHGWMRSNNLAAILIESCFNYIKSSWRLSRQASANWSSTWVELRFWGALLEQRFCAQNVKADSLIGGSNTPKAAELSLFHPLKWLNWAQWAALFFFLVSVARLRRWWRRTVHSGPKVETLFRY